MTDRRVPPDQGGLDWRRLAADLNVSHGVARALWQRAQETSPDDPTQAARAFQGMLEDAAEADATHEPGRETLVDALSARDAASLGAGKWTRVLLEKQKPGPGGTGKGAVAERTTNAQQKPSAEELHSKIAAATEAGNRAAELLASSDPATIIEALRGLRGESGGLVQKILSVAGGTIERMLTATQAAAAATAARETPASADATNAPAASADATGAPATSAPATSAPAASSPAASAPATSAPAASAPTTSAAASARSANVDKVSRPSASAATTNRPPAASSPAKPAAPSTPSSKPSRS